MNNKRGISPDDPRLKQLADMRERELTQAEMARALGASQATVSRLLAFLDSLSPAQKVRVNTQPEANPLAAFMAEEDERRDLLRQIEAEYTANGESEFWAALWAQANAI
jgi:predicted transcriptional regulator